MIKNNINNIFINKLYNTKINNNHPINQKIKKKIII